MALDRIWKFPLEITDRQTIMVPTNFAFLHVGLDPTGALCLWGAVDGSQPTTRLDLVIVGTGNPLPHVGSYLGSVVERVFVWHVFTGPDHSASPNKDFHYVTKDNG